MDRIVRMLSYIAASRLCWWRDDGGLQFGFFTLEVLHYRSCWKQWFGWPVSGKLCSIRDYWCNSASRFATTLRYDLQRAFRRFYSRLFEFIVESIVVRFEHSFLYTLYGVIRTTYYLRGYKLGGKMIRNSLKNKYIIMQRKSIQLILWVSSNIANLIIIYI